MKLIHDNKTEYLLLVPEKRDVFIDFAIKTLNETMLKSTSVQFTVVEKAEKNFISLGNTYALKNAKIKTAILTPYMSCSAKLPIYAVICSAFFVKHKDRVALHFYVKATLLLYYSMI